LFLFGVKVDIQSDKKVTQPILDSCSIKKKHYIEIRKNVVLSVGNVRRTHLLFSCLMQPGEEFPCHGNGSPDEILSLCLVQENREMYP
jgi:hypothetical protein